MSSIFHEKKNATKPLARALARNAVKNYIILRNKYFIKFCHCRIRNY
ncbi:MAG: hypothetical protein ACTSPN_12040 [Promethearchaeota archaeon]